MLRSILERLSRRVVFKRSLPAKYGGRSLYVSPESGLRYWKPTLQHIDDGLFNIVDMLIRPGDAVWDVGANLGLFTFASAHRVGPTGKCLAIEPDAWLVSLLQRSTLLNTDRLIDIVPLAISDRIGLSRFNISVRSRATSYLSAVSGSTQTGGIRQSIWVPTSTLDTLLAQYGKPDFIKIDVETAEHLVLMGADKLLAEARPAIYCEVSDENVALVRGAFLKNNYRLFNGDEPNFPPVDLPVCNTLALPTEHWYLNR